MNSRRHIWLGRGVVLVLVLYWLALCTGTHLPKGSMPGGGGNDKLLHFSAYLGLGVLLCLAWACRRVLTWRMLATIYLVLLGYGLLDELLQIPITGREPELNDWLADACGGALGIALFATANFWWHRLRRPEKAPRQGELSERASR